LQNITLNNQINRFNPKEVFIQHQHRQMLLPTVWRTPQNRSFHLYRCQPCSSSCR